MMTASNVPHNEAELSYTMPIWFARPWTTDLLKPQNAASQHVSKRLFGDSDTKGLIAGW